MWEILTFGGRPYEERESHEILKYLESGRRLVQPPTCTIDLYKVLLKCETKTIILLNGSCITYTCLLALTLGHYSLWRVVVNRGGMLDEQAGPLGRIHS